METASVLEAVLAGLEQDAALPALEALLQRFEVSKRIHRRYSKHWRPEDPADYTDLSRYVRFAEVVDRAYAVVGDLRYLSVLIKCVDTLVSLRADLDPAQAARLARLLHTEREHVEALEGGRR